MCIQVCISACLNCWLWFQPLVMSLCPPAYHLPAWLLFLSRLQSEVHLVSMLCRHGLVIFGFVLRLAVYPKSQGLADLHRDFQVCPVFVINRHKSPYCHGRDVNWTHLCVVQVGRDQFVGLTILLLKQVHCTVMGGGVFWVMCDQLFYFVWCVSESNHSLWMCDWQ